MSIASPRQSAPGAGSISPAAPETRRFVSVGTKLAIATAVVVVFATAILYANLTRHEKARLVASKRAAAEMVAALFAESVSAPLEFEDAQALPEELRKLGTNREVLYAGVWREGRDRPEREFLRDGAPLIVIPADLDAQAVEERAGSVVLITPVRSALGARIGHVVLELSLAAENATFAESKRRMLLMSVGLALGLVLVLVVIARRAIVLPLDRLVAAARRLEGGRTASVPVLANDEVGRLGAAFNRMALAIAEREERVASALRALETKDALISADIEQARQFQRKLLPPLPKAGRFRFAVAYHPADRVGGDIYDIHEVCPSVCRVFLADTTGHGVQASLRTMVLRTEYDSLKRSTDNPARLLERLNEKLMIGFPDLELRCSAVCFDVSSEPDGTCRIFYANAGHPPLLHASGQNVTEIYARGGFLGMVKELGLTRLEVSLAPGDRILAYTDALIEQESPAGVPFGEEPVTRALADAETDLDALLTHLTTTVTRFAQKPRLDDDLTMVAIECLPLDTSDD